MKILYFSDQHLRSEMDKSRFRIDDSYKAQFDELYEVSDIIKKQNVKLILSGGDLFHWAGASNGLIIDTMNWIKSLTTPLVSLVGNHDCRSYRTEDLNNTGLGVLFESGLIGRLNELVLGDIVIRGIHSHVDPKGGNYIFDSKWNKHFKVIVTHNYLSSIPLPFDYVHPKDVVTNANLVLCGHLHYPWTWNNGITTFVNPGGIGRWNREEAQRRPQVLLIETLPFTITEIPLQSSKLGQEIFDLSYVEQEKQKEDQLKNFMESLTNTSFEQSDIEEIVRQAGKTQGIEERILNKSLEKIREAREVLK